MIRTLRDLPLPITAKMPPYAQVADKLADLLLAARELSQLAGDLRQYGRLYLQIARPIEAFAERVFDSGSELMKDIVEQPRFC